ncbi:MAG: molybdopterin-dependent oxidoreductase [Nitrospinota bacterium]|nr:molybdopterin-dependent oxidoreductase [Nitrospinota bacterium]
MSHTESAMEKNPRVKLVIDGRTIEARGGQTILEAASAHGIHIPTLCYLKKLRPIGSCRVCSVEVEGNRGPVMSCVTPVTDGMVVKTDVKWIQDYRRQMIRFILVNHPLDCPVCERSGQCSLQNRTVEFNVADQLFFTEGHQKQKVVNWGVIRYDRNLCVMCERCVRVCHEVQGVKAYKIDGTGITAKINTQDGKPLDCDFCGQCVAVCPVGALNSGVVLPVRSWEVARTRSICPHCAVGCSVMVESKNNMVARIAADDDKGVNNGNLCARGRFGFGAYQSKARLQAPVARAGQQARETSWSAALDEVAGKLKAIREAHGPDSVAVIASERMSNEEAYLLQKVFRAGLGVNRIDTLSNMRNRSLNSGLFGQFGAAAPVIPYSMMAKAGSFLAFGCDMEKENPVVANMARMVMRDKGTPIYIANTRNISFFPDPTIAARYEYGAETELISALAESGAKSAAGVDGAVVSAMAQALKRDGSPLIFIGKEIHDHPRSAQIVAALLDLASRLGGWALLYREYANSQGVNDMGLSPANLPGYMKVAEKDSMAHYSARWGAALDGLKVNEDDIFADLEAGKIKGLLVAGVDPSSHYPEGSAALAAMAKAEFLAVVESFETPVTRIAHVVLPAAVTVEKDGSYTNNEGRPQVFIKATTPMGQAKPEWEIFQELGTRLGMKGACRSAIEITGEIAAVVKGYEGLTAARLAEGEVFASYPSEAANAGAANGAKAVDGRNGDYPLLMLTGNSLFHLDALSHMSPALNSIEPRVFAEVSPEDAAGAGIADGAEVIVESASGTLQAIARVTRRSPRGVVFVPKGFESAPALALVKRGNGVAAIRLRNA